MIQCSKAAAINDQNSEMLEDDVLWEFAGSFVTRIERKFPSVNFHLTHLLVEEIINK
jgi:hypothetical protein